MSTLCDPMDHSPPGSSVHGILQARILEWVAMPSPGDLPDPEIKPETLMSPALTGRFFNTSTTWKGTPKHSLWRIQARRPTLSDLHTTMEPGCPPPQKGDGERFKGSRCLLKPAEVKAHEEGPGKRRGVERRTDTLSQAKLKTVILTYFLKLGLGARGKRSSYRKMERTEMNIFIQPSEVFLVMIYLKPST